MLDRYDQDLLLDYLEGELDSDQRAQLEEALKEDPQLAALLQAMADDRELLRSLPREEMPAELSHDLTHTLERKMLLDDSMDDIGPIPIARNRGLPSEPTRGRGWGRVVGLTGLAASVAVAAGVVVFMLEDPLAQTANRLADQPAAEQDAVEAAEAVDESVATTEDIVRNLTGGELGVSETPSDSTAIRGVTDPKVTLNVPSDTERPAPSTTPSAKPPVGTESLAWVAQPQTVAISAIQPRQQLVLFTEAPEISREQLVNHCIANGIPIVEAEDNNVVTRDEAARELDKQSDQPQADANTIVRADTNYALLINERQLNSLVESFNNDAAIALTDNGNRATFNSQAALVTEYNSAVPGDQLSDSPAPKDPTRPPGFDLNDAVSNTTPYEQPASKSQSQYRLSLPQDLGSPYANGRNADNFIVEQRRNAYASRSIDAAAEADVEANKLAENKKEQSDTVGGQASRGAIKPEIDPEPKASAGPDLAVKQEKTKSEPSAEGGFGADAPDLVEGEGLKGAERSENPPSEVAELSLTDPNKSKAKPGSRLDPARRNWLSPHLPMTDATLILNWRLDTPAEPAELVPIQIKQAPADQVRSLRRQQQLAPRNPATTQPAESSEAQATPTDAAEPKNPDEVLEADAEANAPDAPADDIETGDEAR